MRKTVCKNTHGGRYPSDHDFSGKPCECTGCLRLEVFRLEAKVKKEAGLRERLRRAKEALGQK